MIGVERGADSIKVGLERLVNPVKKAQRGSASKIRIIGGQWRGRKLSVAEAEGLRPTGDRMRETLFNWLAPYIEGARCLDAFAGTGALGFEALSRGAASADFVERDRHSAEAIGGNIRQLGASAAVHHGDFLQFEPREPYHLVFLDPPFAADLWTAALSRLSGNRFLCAQALVYIESPLEQPLTTPPHWRRLKHKRMGQVAASLYETSAETAG